MSVLLLLLLLLLLLMMVVVVVLLLPSLWLCCVGLGIGEDELSPTSAGSFAVGNTVGNAVGNAVSSVAVTGLEGIAPLAQLSMLGGEGSGSGL